MEDIAPLEARLKEAGIEYTRSMSGRPAIFFRDPGEPALCWNGCECCMEDRLSGIGDTPGSLPIGAWAAIGRLQLLGRACGAVCGGCHRPAGGILDTTPAAPGPR